MSIYSILGMPILAGIVAFFVTPLFIAAVDRDLGRRVGLFYTELAHAMLGSAVLLWRENGRPTLKKLGFAGEEGHKIRLDGDDKFLQDTRGYLGRWHNRPFGIALESPGVIIDPRVADLGRRFVELKRTGEFYKENPDENNPHPHRKLHFELPRERRLVEPTFAKAIVRGSGDASLGERIKELTLKSQEPFYTKPSFQHMMLLFALGAGAAIPFIGAKIGENVDAGSLPAPPSIGVGGTVLPADLLELVVMAA